MSSPVMNNIILTGCLVSYVTVFVQELEAGNTLIYCKVKLLMRLIWYIL